MVTRINLPYGNSWLPLTLPASNPCYILTGRYLPGLKDETGAIRDALRSPIESPALLECIGSRDKVAVIVTDNTRHCPDDRILPVILDELTLKIPARNITIIVALGLHAPLTGEQIARKLGKQILDNYRVLNHDPANTVKLGTTSRGTPVEVNSEVVRADFRISTGFIEPHFFAGFSGGRKSIAPGVSSTRAIRHNHRFEMIAHPAARAGSLKGNPVHEDMVEQARIAGLDFIVNVLLNRDRQITHVLAGNPWSAHERGCKLEGATVSVELPRKVDISVVTNGGAPLDLDFYQTCKGIDTASQITRDGGIIIAVSSCFNGAGPAEFCSLHTSAHSPGEVLDKIQQSEDCGTGWQNQILARAQLKQTIYLLSNLDDRTAEKMMVTPIHSLEEGLQKALQVLGNKAEIAVIPEGPLVLPVIKPGS